MNSKERVKRALRREHLDRVPIGFFAIDFDTVERLLGHETYLRAKAKSQIAFWEGRRDEVVHELVDMLEHSIDTAKRKKLRLAPFIGVGCPGIISADGSIERGAQNLPGNWESSHFNLPAVLKEKLPRIGEHETAIVMHNDAVVQGLSEAGNMQDVEHWGVFTIGTGLGNARFTNRKY